MKILGVIMSKHLSFDLHISSINAKARQSMYALRVLGAHGLKGTMMDDVTKATTVARMLYAAPAWWGFVGQGERARLQTTMRRLVRAGYLSDPAQDVEQLYATADTRLFNDVLNNPSHILHGLLPQIKQTPYLLRPRAHNRVIPQADTLARKTFILRMIYACV